MLRFCFILFFLAVTCFSSAQVKIATYIFKEKEYKVYPFRFNNSPEIPPVGFAIPDGEYIVFKEYAFYTDYKNERVTLLDTTKINAIINIKNNKVEGEATFFRYYRKHFKSYCSTS